MGIEAIKALVTPYKFKPELLEKKDVNNWK